MNNNITTYLTEFSLHLNEIQKNYDHLKEELISSIGIDRQFTFNIKSIANDSNETTNVSDTSYWDEITKSRITDQKMVFALIVSVAPFLFTLMLLLIGLAVSSSLFNLKRKYKRRHHNNNDDKTKANNKTLILSSDKNCYKISVIDEEKRQEIKKKKRHSILNSNQIHFHHHNHHKLNAADFNLPDERKVPIVLVQDVLAKDQREELSRLNALEIFNNLNPVQLNVNNLPLELKRVTTAELIRALQRGQMTYQEANEIALKNKLFHRNRSPDRMLMNKNYAESLPTLLLPPLSSSQPTIDIINELTRSNSVNSMRKLRTSSGSNSKKSTSIETQACTSSSVATTPTVNKTFGKFTVYKINSSSLVHQPQDDNNKTTNDTYL